MKVKEVEKTANVAWSPAKQHPVYLAMGTAAQQLDATFSTSAALDIYALNLGEPGLDMELVGSIPSDYRFHKLAWGSFGMEETETPSGLLMGGADSGKLFVWNPAKLINNEDCLVDTLEKHTGAVTALDINKYQPNMFASGASDSEIYIWDLNSPGSAMAPGQKSQPPDDVTCLAWNQQVQHILASTYAGRCVVWDLRKNEPIIKVSDSMSRIKCKLASWHPDVATQMCLASEDDHTPVIQLWDLRFATSPLKSLESHQRGILSMAWCPQDPDLLLSCGKDNRILCWNPNSNIQTGEVVYELPTSNQWSFDVQWCPRNPAIISSCSFDGHISVYSLMGGAQPPGTPSNISESFPMDPFSQGAPPQQQSSEPAAAMLKKPPKWLRRPVGASFGFGGKLVTFETTKPLNPQQPVQHLACISQVVTETQLINNSNQLENALVNTQYAEFCSLKIANSKSPVEENVWNFLKANFEANPRTQYLRLLGYDQGKIAHKVGDLSEGEVDEGQGDVAGLANQVAQLNTSGQENGDGWTPEDSDAFDQIAANEKEEDRYDSPLPIAVEDDCDGLVTQALLTANFEAAVDVCLHNNRMAEAIILANAGGRELMAKTQKKFFHRNKGSLNRLISSVVTGDFEHVVRTCDLDNWKEALAVTLTYARGEDFSQLCDVLGSRLEAEQDGHLAINACLCYIVAGNVERLVSCWNNITKNNSTPHALQDIVEKVMILRKAVEAIKGQATEISSGALAQKLSDYASLLAAQGSLQTAINYLGNTQEASLNTLRDRLYSCLGQASSKPFPVVNVQPEGAPAARAEAPQASQAQPSTRQRTNSGYYNSEAGSPQTVTTPSSTYYTQNAYPGYSGPSAGPATFTPQPTYSTGQAMSGAAAATGAAPITQGPLAKKYPAYSQSQGQGGAYVDSYANPGVPFSQADYPPNSYASSGYVPSSQAGVPSSQPQLFDPTSQQTPGAPYATPTGNSQASGPNLPSYQEMRPGQAWNDPPPLHSKKKQAVGYEAPAPITTPIFGVPENQPMDQGPPGAPSYTGAAQQQIYNPGAYQQAQAPAPEPARAQEPAPPAPKAPIPQENIVLQEIFDKLASMCMTKATNPQVKRKLEDVFRKLEALYDKLRGQVLSPNIVLGLHQIIQAIQAYDYQTGLAYHTQMVSQGNFSEISSFMPGIKVLMQTAMQLQVYVQ